MKKTCIIVLLELITFCYVQSAQLFHIEPVPIGLLIPVDKPEYPLDHGFHETEGMRFGSMAVGNIESAFRQHSEVPSKPSFTGDYTTVSSTTVGPAVSANPTVTTGAGSSIGTSQQTDTHSANTASTAVPTPVSANPTVTTGAGSSIGTSQQTDKHSANTASTAVPTPVIANPTVTTGAGSSIGTSQQTDTHSASTGSTAVPTTVSPNPTGTTGAGTSIGTSQQTDTHSASTGSTAKPVTTPTPNSNGITSDQIANLTTAEALQYMTDLSHGHILDRACIGVKEDYQAGGVHLGLCGKCADHERASWTLGCQHGSCCLKDSLSGTRCIGTPRHSTGNSLEIGVCRSNCDVQPFDETGYSKGCSFASDTQRCCVARR